MSSSAAAVKYRTMIQLQAVQIELTRSIIPAAGLGGFASSETIASV